MKKLDALTQFLEEIHGEAIVPVETSKDSKLVVYINEEAADEEEGVTISREDTALILASPLVIERFYEALGCSESASIVVYDTVVPEKSLDALEKHFSAVDEA